MICAALFAIPAATATTAAGAPTITEYSAGLSNNAAPVSIVAAPDGNLWFTQSGSTNAIDRITPAGVITSYPTGGSGSPLFITLGPDGKLWFTESGSAKIGTIDPQTHVVSEYAPPSGVTPYGITAGPEGDVWFTGTGSKPVLGRIVPSTHLFTTLEIPLNSNLPFGIAAGPKGDLWVTEYSNPGAIERLDPKTSTFTHFSTGLTADSNPAGITLGPDGNLWFTEAVGRIARIKPAGGEITEFSSPLSAAPGSPLDITGASDGNLYFTESNDPGALAQITTSGAISQYTAGLTTDATPWGIAAGPDGNVWFVESSHPAKVGRLTVAPSVTSETATGVSGQSATLTASVGASAQATSVLFEYGESTVYGAHSSSTSAGSAGTPATVSAAVSGLAAGRTYHFRGVASNATGTTYGPDATFTTAALASASPTNPTTSTSTSVPAQTLTSDAGLPPLTTSAAKPTIGRAAGVEAVSGLVLVKGPHGSFIPLSGAGTVPMGSTLDTTHGVLRLLTALPGGRTQAATVWSGAFVVSQSAHGSGLTDLTPSGAHLLCPRHRKARAGAAKSRAKARTLWAADNHGQYSTHGANSVATVLGTEWETVETCAGTLTRVSHGRVRVRDLHRRVTVTVSAGHSYLARP